MIVVAFRDVYLVLSEAGKVYVVDLELPACSCPAFILRGECKHIRAAMNAVRLGKVIRNEEAARKLLERAILRDLRDEARWRETRA